MSFETRSSTNNLLAAKKNYPMLSSPSSQFRLNSISAKSASISAKSAEALAAISEKHNLTYMVLLLTVLTLLLKVAE